MLADPLHPYTWGLLQSLPSASEEQDHLRAIRGAPPSLVALPDRLLVPPPLRLPGGGGRRRLRQRRCPSSRPHRGTASRLTRCHLLDPRGVLNEETHP